MSEPQTVGPSSRYGVIRPAPDLPAGFLPESWNGRWIDLVETFSRETAPSMKHTVFGAEAVATDRFEEREDGVKARVFEVRPPIPDWAK